MIMSLVYCHGHEGDVCSKLFVCFVRFSPINDLGPSGSQALFLSLIQRDAKPAFRQTLLVLWW